MNNRPSSKDTPRLRRHLFSTACALLTVFVLSALAVPHRAAAGQFASTRISPSTQAVAVGAPVSVDIVLAVPADASWGLTNGVQAWVNFDATKLQVASITPGAASPFTSVSVNQFDNTAGNLSFKALGSSVSNRTITVATIVFTPIAAGTANVWFANVNQYINNSPYGVNGGATGGSITVTAPPAVTVFGSGISPVIAWDPIFPAAAISAAEEGSKPVPTVGYDANWVNPHPASVFPVGSHPWEFIAPFDFAANWINAWSNLASRGPGGQSWTKYSTTVTGSGDFVLQFLADNASWIYLDGNLVGNQDWDWGHTSTGRYTIQLSGAGPHELSFIIWDGGGLAGGKFRLETTASFLENNPGEDLPPPPTPADATPPVISAPANITTEATGPSGAAVAFNATATDNVDGPVPVLAQPPSGSTFSLGTTLVLLGAADAAGNAAASSFTVTVRDTIAPIVIAPANQVLEATDATGTVATFSAITSDAVGVTSTTYSAASGSTFPIGTTTVNVTAADAAGNTSSGSFTVTVRDTIAPALTVPSNQVREATGPAGATATFAASATDAVGVTSLTYSPASGSTFPIGTTTVNVTAADAAGNTSSGSFTVTVRDTTAPSLTGVSPSSATLWPPNHQMVPISIAATSNDLVGVTSLKIISVVSSEPDNGLGDGDTANDIQITGALTVNLRAERSGKGNGRTYTITVEAKDAAGNTTTATTTVSVPKSQGGKK